jgi:succinate dehydrogenase / fumarate reductase, flavoprotein subunit
MSMIIKEFDAVVIGAGGSGMRAALQLSESGANIAVISKVFPTRSHTVSAQGGMAASLGNVQDDKWQWHTYDTIMGSDYLGDQNAIEYMCKNAPAAVYELEKMGMPFSRLENGKIYQRFFGGHTKNNGAESVERACAAADRTGHAMLHTLYQQNVKAGTNFFSEWYAIDLVRSEQGGVSGVIAMSIETGDLAFFHSRAVVLATGGAGQIFQSTTNAYTNTGDGLGLALRAGLPVQDIEFWQFHPTGIYGSGCLVTEGCRGEGGYMLNANGERYMERYAPTLKDLACRDIVSRASIMEILEGRGVGPDKDHVLLKLDHLGADLLEEKLPGIVELAKTFAGVDPSKEPIPVLPTCHYMMGGVPTNIHGQAITVDSDGDSEVVPGLYAAGECACVSVHGANRLGANSLLDIVVFGRAAGMHLENAIKTGLEYQDYSLDALEDAVSRYNRWESNESGERPADLRDELQKIMQRNFGVFRDAKHMESGLKELVNLKSKIDKAQLLDKSQAFNTARIEALELDNLYAVALATATCALNRTESRGAHSRYDFTERDDQNWHKHTVYFADGTINYSSVNMQPKQLPTFELKAREK